MGVGLRPGVKATGKATAPPTGYAPPLDSTRMLSVPFIGIGSVPRPQAYSTSARSPLESHEIAQNGSFRSSESLPTGGGSAVSGQCAQG